MQYNDKYNLKAFIAANAPYLTVADMADELDLPYGKVNNLCIEGNIVPVKQREKVLNAVREFAPKRTLTQLCKMIDIGPSMLKRYLDELRINCLPENQKTQSFPSAAPISGLMDSKKRAKAPFVSTIAKRLDTVRFTLPNNVHYAPSGVDITIIDPKKD